MHLPIYLPILLTASAVIIRAPLRLSTGSSSIQNKAAYKLTERALVGTAGIGVEFETIDFILINSACKKDDTTASKGKVIGKRTGINFKLTADTTSEAGVLHAEYILDGQNIKVGSGDAAKAGAAAAADMVSAKTCLFAEC